MAHDDLVAEERGGSALVGVVVLPLAFLFVISFALALQVSDDAMFAFVALPLGVMVAGGAVVAFASATWLVARIVGGPARWKDVLRACVLSIPAGILGLVGSAVLFSRELVAERFQGAVLPLCLVPHLLVLIRLLRPVMGSLLLAVVTPVVAGLLVAAIPLALPSDAIGLIVAAFIVTPPLVVPPFLVFVAWRALRATD